MYDNCVKIIYGSDNMMYIFYILIILIFTSAIKCFVDCEKVTDFFFRRSKCDKCEKQLNFIDLVPVISFILFRGRCRYCHKKISLDIFFYEIGSLLFTLLFFIFQENFVFLSIFDLFIVIIIYFLAIEDVKTYEVNDRLLCIFFILCMIKGFVFEFNFVSLFFMGMVSHILYFLARGGLGYGDIKVFCLLFLMLNTYESFYLLIYTFLYAGMVAIILLLTKKVTRKTKLALLPYIVLGYITVLIVREVILW